MRIELLLTHLSERHRTSNQRIQQTPQPDVPITHNSQQRRNITLLNILSTSITKLPVLVRLVKKPDLLEITHPPHNRIPTGHVLEGTTVPAHQFIRRRLMRFNKRKYRIQCLNVACPTAKHRDDTAESIRRHDEIVTERDDDPFPREICFETGRDCRGLCL